MSAMDDPELIKILTRMETKLDNIIGISHDHESRIRNLEKKVWALPSAAFILGAIDLYLQIKK